MESEPVNRELEKKPPPYARDLEPPKETLSWKLGSGETVWERRVSHLHDDILPLLPEIFAAVKSESKDFFIHVTDFGRPIGLGARTETNADDEMVYAQRANRTGLTRFVKNRERQPGQHATVILKRMTDPGKEGDYLLISAFIGDPAPPEPWDKNAAPDSRDYWDHHALVWGSEPIVPGTETKECPW